MYCDRRRNGQKPPRTKPSRPKTPDKSSRTKTQRTIEIEFVQGDFVRIFCTMPTKKIGGSEMCDVLLGGPGMSVCMYVCMYVCIYVCMYVMYVCMYVCMLITISALDVAPFSRPTFQMH